MARDVGKRRRGFGTQDKSQRARIEFRQFDWRQFCTRLLQHLESSFVERAALLSLRPLLFVLRRCGWTIKLRLEITDTQSADVCVRIPVERRIADSYVLTVRTVDRMQNCRTVFDAATHWADLVHGPAQAHRPITTDAAVRRTKTSHTTSRRRRNNRPERFSSNRESNQPSGRRGRGPGRRAARTCLCFIGLPWITRNAGEPPGALRDGAHRQLRDDHRTRIVQAFHTCAIVSDYLIAIRFRAP